MTGKVKAAAIAGSLIAALVVLALTRNALAAGACCLVGALVWVLAPSTSGRAADLPDDAASLDPREINEVRRQNPGMTVAEAARRLSGSDG